MATKQELWSEAQDIAGAILDDVTEGTNAERVRQAAEWRNMGTDGDLTTADRKRLREIADAMES